MLEQLIFYKINYSSIEIEIGAEDLYLPTVEAIEHRARRQNPGHIIGQICRISWNKKGNGINLKIKRRKPL